MPAEVSGAAGSEPAGSRRALGAAAFGLALASAALYGLPDLRVAFSGPYVVQEDARQFAFWTRRFQDPALFPHDPIADYFQAVAPAGYALLYRAAAVAGLDPVLFGKLLPVPLAVVAVGYTFRLTAHVLPSPAAAFLASVFLSQQLWLTDELPSGSPRAFAVPLLAAFLYYLARRARLRCLACLALQGLFYPHGLLISCGTLVLGLVRWEGGRLRVSRDRRDWVFTAAGLGVAALSVLPFLLSSARYGPTVTADEARRMPEFFRGGRARYFDLDAWDFWVNDMRSGLLGKFFRAHRAHVYAGKPMLWGGLLLPVLLAARRKFPLASHVTPAAGLLFRMALASLILFAAAHIFLFHLLLPNRYSRFSARVVFAAAGGTAWTIVGDAVLRRLPRRGPARGALLLTAAVGVVVFLLTPFFQPPAGSYIVGQASALYRFLEQQPKNVLVASISPEADNIPNFARRSVLVGSAFALPYQLGYYRPFRHRVLDLLRAEYAEDPRVLREYIRANGVDFILLDRWSFRPRWLLQDSWVRQYRPLVEELAARMERGEKPALETLAERCSTLETEKLILVDAKCLLETS